MDSYAGPKYMEYSCMHPFGIGRLIDFEISMAAEPAEINRQGIPIIPFSVPFVVLQQLL